MKNSNRVLGGGGAFTLRKLKDSIGDQEIGHVIIRIRHQQLYILMKLVWAFNVVRGLTLLFHKKVAKSNIFMHNL